MYKHTYIAQREVLDLQRSLIDKTQKEFDRQFILANKIKDVGYRFNYLGENFEIAGHEVVMRGSDLLSRSKRVEIRYIAVHLNKLGKATLKTKLFDVEHFIADDNGHFPTKPIHEVDNDVRVTFFENSKRVSAKIVPLSKANREGADWANQVSPYQANRTYAISEIKGIVYQ